MRHVWSCVLTVVTIFLVLPTAVSAAKLNAADFPLRVHIVDRNGNRHYHGYGGGITSLNSVDGMGQANLFENDRALGFDFTYDCGQPITHQSTYETFMARWKNRGRVLEIVQPAIGGKPGDVNSCDLKVTMKQDTVYFLRNGLIEEPADKYKQWMIDHQYDPEHGRNEPVGLAP